ncbi:AraC family transcriptional regulator [Bosea sp. TND4EK4]|uniref:helix-turn-helix domain-containing protein n=2 Tax=unclassified Bosea (in: a-proteobacteria) TaxID=2653178 RepID=UPI000955C785|nr:AraC family transcriptional regulator [Bosea sp. TND4EK4]SIR29858.1 transcriptional regulator, AraC family [Bosea sp. TND4EK4]
MSDTSSLSNGPAGAPAGEVIAALLADAGAAVAVDRAAARFLLTRAIALLDDAPQDSRPGGLAAWQMRRLERFVEANLGSPITLESMAATARLSSSHFGRAFKATGGETPHSWVLRKRVERARKLMRESTLPLAEIALDCGLSDQSHLNRVFRRYSGVSPNAWRRMARA